MRDTQRPGPQVLVCLSRGYYLVKTRAVGPGLTESMKLFG